MILLDGKQISQDIQIEIKQKVDAIQGHRKPHLAVILVGSNAASLTYVQSKIKTCKTVGFESTLLEFETSVSEEELLNKINEINCNPDIDGLIVQLPLPKHISETKVTEKILPEKDVDGFHPINIGRMAQNQPALLPATPAGILELLKRAEIDTKGKHCVVVGRSNIVGMPVSLLMMRNNMPGNSTVTICHSQTQNLEYYTKQADILIVAAGKLEMITKDMVKEGAIVIDVGIHRVEDSSKKSGFRLAGDVKFNEVASICSYITPVPGGVGPMTIAMLLQNTLQAYNNNLIKS